MKHHSYPIHSSPFGTRRYIDSYEFGDNDQQRMYIHAALHSDELPVPASACLI